MVGGPATGKTTIGRKLADYYKLAYMSKDGVKEPIFDHVGHPTSLENDSPLSGIKMDDAAQSILMYLIEEHVNSNTGCLIDSTFGKSHVPNLKKLFNHYNFKPIQVVCFAEIEILRKRYHNRANQNLRHPGHLDKILADSFEKINEMFNINKPLTLDSHNFKVDTSSFTEEDFDSLIDSINVISGQDSSTGKI